MEVSSRTTRDNNFVNAHIADKDLNLRQWFCLSLCQKVEKLKVL